MALIVYAVITVAILGGLLGLCLAVAHSKLAVEKDPRIKALEDILPQANCGACGYPGCSGYAAAIINDDIDISMCPPGGNKVIKKIGSLLGKEVVEGETMVAHIFCGGNLKTAKTKYSYLGISDCNQAVSMFGGSKQCSHGCLGLGSCVRACNFDAIYITPELDVVVDKDKCTGCALCEPVCPKNIIRMVPYKARIFNCCSSRDKAGPVKKSCNIGCTACKLCIKACNFEAVSIKDNFAIIDHEKCTECGDCYAVCGPMSIRSSIPLTEMSERAQLALAEEAKAKKEEKAAPAIEEKKDEEKKAS